MIPHHNHMLVSVIKDASAKYRGTPLRCLPCHPIYAVGLRARESGGDSCLQDINIGHTLSLNLETEIAHLMSKLVTLPCKFA